MRVCEPQVHSGTRPKRRRVYRVSEKREESARRRDGDDEGDGVVGVAVKAFSEWFRRRARRPRRVWIAIPGAEPRKWCRAWEK